MEQDSLDMSLDIRQQVSDLVTPNVIEPCESSERRIEESSYVNVGEAESTSEVVSVATPVVDITKQVMDDV